MKDEMVGVKVKSTKDLEIEPRLREVVNATIALRHQQRHFSTRSFSEIVRQLRRSHHRIFLFSQNNYLFTLFWSLWSVLPLVHHRFYIPHAIIPSIVENEFLFGELLPSSLLFDDDVRILRDSSQGRSNQRLAGAFA